MQVDRRIVESSRKGLRISVNIYSLPTKISSTEKRRGLTVFLVHGLGFHKATWEPIIEKLFSYQTSNTWYVERAIAFDACNHGDSAMLNRDKLANESYTYWFVNARDILAVIRQLRSLNLCPNSSQSIVGIGHSWGADCLLLSEALCPLTFSCIIATEAVLHLRVIKDDQFLDHLRKKQWMWENKNDVKKHFKARKLYNSWDERCLKLHIKHGVESVGGKWALKCRPHNEAVGYAGGDYSAYHLTFSLWKIRCPTSFLIGEKSIQCPFKFVNKTTECMADRRVHVMDNVGHLLVYENPDSVAEKYAMFLDDMVPRAYARSSLDLCKAKL